MVVQDRYNALQNETVRLYRTFEMSGILVPLIANPTVEILDTDGVGVLGVVTAVMQSPGIYYADWNISISLPVGRYYDRWTYQFPQTDSGEIEVTNFDVHPKDSIINFTGSTTSVYLTPKTALLVRDFANFFIYETQHIPIYSEQAQRTSDPTRFNFAYKIWNPDPRPVIRVNNKIVSDGWYADYCGNVIFEKPLSAQDVVKAAYNFSYFTQDDLAGFLKMGLYALNAIPPATQTYPLLDIMPVAWNHLVLVYAAMQALRRILLGMTFQETEIIWGGFMGAGGGESGASAARDTFKALYEQYNAIWTAQSKDVKKVLPKLGQIVVPEFTLPGGRARWYAYMFSGSSM